MGTEKHEYETSSKYVVELNSKYSNFTKQGSASNSEQTIKNPVAKQQENNKNKK